MNLRVNNNIIINITTELKINKENNKIKIIKEFLFVKDKKHKKENNSKLKNILKIKK